MIAHETMETLFYEKVDFEKMTKKRFWEIEQSLLYHARTFGTLEFCRFKHCLSYVCRKDSNFEEILNGAYRPLPEALQDEKDVSKIKTKLNVYHLLTTPERRKAVERSLGKQFVQELEEKFAREHPWYDDACR